MYRVKSKIIVAVCIFMVCVIAVCAQETGSNRKVFTTPDTSSVEYTSLRHTHVESGKQVANRLNLVDYEKKLENNITELWFNEDSASIRIVDKKTGYVWGGLFEGNRDDMNKKWTHFGEAICSVEYYSEKNTEVRVSISNEDDVDVTYEWKENLLICDFYIYEAEIGLAFTLTLCDDSLLFEVVEGSLREDGECLIKSLYFMPFLGSTYADEVDGYMFVPDGCGALIRYSPSSTYLTGFDQRVYGLDASIDRLSQVDNLNANRNNDFMVETPQVNVPVYGIVHGANQNALFAIIESGEEYASIFASVAGVVTEYNWITARFDYRRMHVHAVGGSGKGNTLPQKKPENMLPALRIYLMHGDNANYSGMAELYREKLIEDGVLKSTNTSTKQIPMRLEVVCSEVKDGFFFNTTTALTTVEQANKFVDNLALMDINNLVMVMQGWQKGGINGSDYGSLEFENEIGNKKSFTDLEKKLENKNGKLYLYSNVASANPEQISLSKKALVDAARSFASKSSPNLEQMYPDRYFIKIDELKENINNTNKKLDMFDFSFDTVGSNLYGDYSKNAEYTRTKSMSAIKKILSKNKKVALYNPNNYLWEYTSDYFDIPTSSSQYLYETDTVPFLQMVLKGSIDYYAPFCNQGFYSKTSVLKMIEYGVYPSFLVMNSENTELSDTPLTEFFSLNFNDWRGTIDTVYHEVNGALSKVIGQTIKSHRAVADGVVKIGYSNGTTIYVNYSSKEVQIEGVTIPKMGYVVI